MKKITKIVLSTLQVQLFLNIISLIIIAHWGLPISYIAPLSNIIFSPFLTLFLLFSSLIFFLELAHIPSEWLIYILEILTHKWSTIMAWADKSWTLSISKPSIMFTIFALGSCFGILQSKQLHHPFRRILAFTTLLIVLILYLGYTQPPEYAVHTFTLGKKDLSVISTKGSLSLIDHGALAQIGCTRGWIEFTLLPFLRQNYAQDTISHLIMLKPTAKSLTNMGEVCDLTRVKNIYVPYWQGETPYNFIKAFMSLQEKIKQRGKLHRIGKKNILIPLTATSYLEIIPLNGQTQYQTIQFPTSYISCVLESTSIPITQLDNRKESSEE